MISDAGREVHRLLLDQVRQCRPYERAGPWRWLAHPSWFPALPALELRPAIPAYYLLGIPVIFSGEQAGPCLVVSCLSARVRLPPGWPHVPPPPGTLRARPLSLEEMMSA